MNRIKSIVVATLAVVVAAAYTMPALPVSAQSSSSLSIAPKKTYLIEPGKSVNDKLTIRNLDDSSDLNLTLRVVDFTFTDEGGTPKLMMAADAPQTTWSLKPFLKVPKSITIPKGGSKTIDTNITIPKGHGAGSYYSAIIYSSGEPADLAGNVSNVGLSASGVTLVFTQIPGKVTENLKLDKFGAYREATPSSPAGYIYFATDAPQKVAYTLKNSGNVTEAPVGSITLKGWFGAPIVIDNVNPNGSLALIGQTRTYSTCIKLKDAEVSFQGKVTKSVVCDSPSLWPGFYSASLDLYYGQNGNLTQEIVGNGSFWYLPWWFIIVFFVLLAIVAFAVWRAYGWVRVKLYGHSYKKSSRKSRK